MDGRALLVALALCLVAAAVEGLTASGSGRRWFARLQQPAGALPLSLWYVVGGLYHLLFGIVAYRVLSRPSAPLWVVVLLAAAMLANSLANGPLLRYRSLTWLARTLVPFLALIVLLVVLLEVDTVSAALLAIYAAWLGYDLYYFRALGKLNREAR